MAIDHPVHDDVLDGLDYLIEVHRIKSGGIPSEEISSIEEYAFKKLLKETGRNERKRAVSYLDNPE